MSFEEALEEDEVDVDAGVDAEEDVDETVAADAELLDRLESVGGGLETLLCAGARRAEGAERDGGCSCWAPTDNDGHCCSSGAGCAGWSAGGDGGGGDRVA